MDEPALLIIGVLGIVAGTAILVALLQERTIDGVRDTIGAGRRDDVEAAARGLRQGRESAEWAARRSSEDLGHLVNLVGAGIVRLDDDLVVQLANEAAQAFLDRLHHPRRDAAPPHLGIGRDVIEPAAASVESGERGRDDPTVLCPDDAEARVPRGECAERRVVVARSDADPGRLPQRAQRVAVARAQIANLHRSPY